MLRSREDTRALVAVIEALGDAWDRRAAAVLLEAVRVDHPDGVVRLALAQALPGGADEEPERGAAVDVLVRLTGDTLAEVRDWACFGLGQLGADTQAARDALAARLSDVHMDARAGALLALAELGDSRALPACRQTLAGAPDSIGLLALKAATALSDPSLVPALQRLEIAWRGDEPDDYTTALDQALLACRAGRP